MKKPIGKVRRRYLKKFLTGDRKGWWSSHNFYYGLLPDSPSHPQGRLYWKNKYFTIHYDTGLQTKEQQERQEKQATRYGYVYSPLTNDDIKYIENLVNIDPFIADEDNKEYVT